MTTTVILLIMLVVLMCIHSVTSMRPSISNFVWTLTPNTEVEISNWDQFGTTGRLVIMPDSASSAMGPISTVAWYSVVIRNSSFSVPVSIGNGSVLLKNLRVELVNVTVNLTDASRSIFDNEEHVFSVLLGNDSNAPALAPHPVQGNVTIVVSGGSSFVYSGNGSNAATLLSLVVSATSTSSCEACTVSVTDVRSMSMNKVLRATVLSLFVHIGATAACSMCSISINSSSRGRSENEDDGGGIVSVSTAQGSGWLSLLSMATRPKTIVQLTNVAIACRSLTTIAISGLSGYSTCLSIAHLSSPSNAVLNAENCSVTVEDVNSVSLVEDGPGGWATLLSVRSGKENTTLQLTNAAIRARRVSNITAASSKPWLSVLSMVGLADTRSLQCAGCSFIADSVGQLLVNAKHIGSVLTVAIEGITVPIPDQIVAMTEVVFEAVNTTAIEVVADAGSALILSFASTGAASCVNCRFSASSSGQLTATSPNGPRSIILSVVVWKSNATLFFSNVSFMATSVATLNASSASWAVVLSAGMAVAVQPLRYESCSMTAVSVDTVRVSAGEYSMALSLFVTDGNDISIENVTFNATNVTWIKVDAVLRQWALIASIAVDSNASAVVNCTNGTFLLQNVDRVEAVTLYDRLASVLSVAASDDAYGLSLLLLKMAAMFVGVINVTSWTGMSTCLSVLTVSGGSILRCVDCQLVARHVDRVHVVSDSGVILIISARLTSTVVRLDRLAMLAANSSLLEAITGGATGLVGSFLLALRGNGSCVDSQVSISDVLQVILSTARRSQLLSATTTAPTVFSNLIFTMERVSVVPVSSRSGAAVVLGMVTSGDGTNASNCTFRAQTIDNLTVVAGVSGLSLALSVYITRADLVQSFSLIGSDIRSVTVTSVNVAAAWSIVRDPYALASAVVRKINVVAHGVGTVNVSSSSDGGSASAFSVIAPTSPMSATDITFSVEQTFHSVTVSSAAWATAFSFVISSTPNISCNGSGIVFNVSQLPLLAVQSSGLWAVALSFVATSSSPLGFGRLEFLNCSATSMNVGNHSVTASSFASLLSAFVTEATAANFTGLTLQAAGSQSLQATATSGDWACILSTVTNGSQSSFIGTDVLAAISDGIMVSTSAWHMYSTVLCVTAGEDSNGAELLRATFQARFVASIRVVSYAQALLLSASSQASVLLLVCTDCTFGSAFVANISLDASFGASVLSLEVFPNTTVAVARLTMQAIHGAVIRVHSVTSYACITAITTGSVSTQVSDSVFAIHNYTSVVAVAQLNSGCVILAVRLRNSAPASAALTRCRFAISNVSNNLSASGRMSLVLSGGTLTLGSDDVIMLASCSFSAMDVGSILVSGVVGAVVLSVSLLTDPSSGFVADTNFTAIRVSRIRSITSGALGRAAILGILKDSSAGDMNVSDSTWAAVDVGVIEVASGALYSAVLSPVAMSGTWRLRQLQFTAEWVQLLNSTSGGAAMALSLMVAQSVLSADVVDVMFAATSTGTISTFSTASGDLVVSAALSILVNLSSTVVSVGQVATMVGFRGVRADLQNVSMVVVTSLGASPSFALCFSASLAPDTPAANGSVACDSCSFAADNTTVISARSESQQSAVLSVLVALASLSMPRVDLSNISLAARSVSAVEATATVDDGGSAVMLIGASSDASVGGFVNCSSCSASATQIGSVIAVGRSEAVIGTARAVSIAANITITFTNVSTVDATTVSGNAVVGCGVNLAFRHHASFSVVVRHTEYLTCFGAIESSAGVVLASVSDNEGEVSVVTVGIVWQDITSVNVYSAGGSANGGCVNISGNSLASVTASVQWSSVAADISGLLGSESMRFHSHAVPSMSVSVELCSSQLRVRPRSLSAPAAAFLPAGTSTTGGSRLQRLLLHDVEVLVVNGIECLCWAPQTSAVYINKLRLFGCGLFGWGTPGNLTVPLPAVKAVQLNGNLLSNSVVMSLLPGAGWLQSVHSNVSTEGTLGICGAAAWASPYSWSPTVSLTRSSSMSLSTGTSSATQTASLPVTLSLQHCTLDSCFVAEMHFIPNVSGAVTLRPADVTDPPPLTAASIGAAELHSWINGAIRAGGGALRVGVRCGPSPSVGSDYDGSWLRVAAGRLAVAGSQLLAAVEDEWLPEAAASRTEVMLAVGGSGATVVVPLMYWYSHQTVLVDLLSRCGPNALNASNLSTTGWMRIAVPVAPLSLPTSTATTTVVATSQWTSSVGGATASSTVGRIAVWRRLMYCESGGGPSSGGMLGVSIGGSDDAATRYGRGAVVGNAGIVFGAALGALCLGLWWVALLRRLETKSTASSSMVSDACLRMCLPSSLLSLWAMTAPTTAESTAWLLRGRGDATDAFLGVIGLVHLLGGTFAVGLLCFRDPRWLSVRLVAGTERRRADSGSPALGKAHVAASRLWRLLRAKWVRWEPVTAATGSTQNRQLQSVSLTTSRLAGALLDEYRYLWFAGLELAALMVDCLIGAVSSAADGLSVAACSALGWVSLAVVCLQLVVCLASRPFLTRLSFAYAVVTVVLAVVSRGVRLWLLSNSGSLSPDRVSQGMTAADAVDMMASTLGTLKTLFLDVPSLLLFLVRYSSEIRSLLLENRNASAGSMLLLDTLDDDPPTSDGISFPLLRAQDHSETGLGEGGASEEPEEVVEGDAATEVDDMMIGSMSSFSVSVAAHVVPLSSPSDVRSEHHAHGAVGGPGSSVLHNGLIFRFEENSSFSLQELTATSPTTAKNEL